MLLEFVGSELGGCAPHTRVCDRRCTQTDVSCMRATVDQGISVVTRMNRHSRSPTSRTLVDPDSRISINGRFCTRLRRGDVVDGLVKPCPKFVYLCTASCKPYNEINGLVVVVWQLAGG